MINSLKSLRSRRWLNSLKESITLCDKLHGVQRVQGSDMETQYASIVLCTMLLLKVMEKEALGTDP